MAPKRNSWIITDIVPKDSDTRVVHKPKDNTNGPKKKKKRNSKEAVVTTKDKLVTDWVKEGEVFDSQKSKNKHHMMSTNQSFKTNNFRDNCLKNRMEKGMILLSPNVEKKIYTMKKALRKKGFDEMEIKDLIRKRRREEENKFLKNSKQTCFKCRKFGHRLAECPLNANDTEEGVDVCYRCGSSEHKLSECHQKSTRLAYVKCFMCSEVGHITRDCPQNQRGIYIKGGSCKACQSVNHLIKDCPQNQKDKELAEEITLSTLEGNHSIDADAVDIKPTIVKTEVTKKVVKF